jgi:formamidopyrimidine-DNA glycosylase
VVAGGLDPVADAVSWTAFARVLLGRSGKIKALLMDPEVVAGIGPIYSDEILWDAGLRYDRLSDGLSSQEIRRLYRSLVETLHEAVKHRGTSTDDHPFVDLYGKPGDYQDELKVHAREGEPCRRCRAPVQKARFANRPVYFCAQCQV